MKKYFPDFGPKSLEEEKEEEEEEEEKEKRPLKTKIDFFKEEAFEGFRAIF